MSSSTFRSSRPDGWNQPRTYSDPTLRRARFGASQPMARPGLLDRLFGRA